MAKGPKPRPPLERFVEKFVVDEVSGCWLWTAWRDAKGYGYFDGQPAPRFAYAAWVGSIPQDYLVCHYCDTPACICPEHLFLGTPKDNTADMYAKNRQSPPPILLGEKARLAKLNPALVRDIRLARTRGESVAALASRYQMSLAGISAVVSRRTWKHVA